MCVLGHTTHAEHEMTPTRVSFRAQRVWDFMEKIDEEDVVLTVNEINKNLKKWKKQLAILRD
jgi:hypothetical protein